MNALRNQWDKLGMYLLLMAYGGYSIFYPIVSVERAAPNWAEILLGTEFLVAGVLLVVGMGTKKGYRMAGLLVVCIGLFTISGLLAIVGGTRVLAYAFLFGAFAMSSVYDIRKERRENQQGRSDADRLVEQLNSLVEDSKGDRV